MSGVTGSLTIIDRIIVRSGSLRELCDLKTVAAVIIIRGGVRGVDNKS